MNYQQFQEQIESISGLCDWKYHECELGCGYFTAERNNGQFKVAYSISRHRWNAIRRDEKDKKMRSSICYSLQDAIEFLNMPIAVDTPKPSKDSTIVSAIGILLIGMAIGWISAIATVQIPPNYLHSSACAVRLSNK